MCWRVATLTQTTNTQRTVSEKTKLVESKIGETYLHRFGYKAETIKQNKKIRSTVNVAERIWDSQSTLVRKKNQHHKFFVHVNNEIGVLLNMNCLWFYELIYEQIGINGAVHNEGKTETIKVFVPFFCECANSVDLTRAIATRALRWVSVYFPVTRHLDVIKVKIHVN